MGLARLVSGLAPLRLDDARCATLLRALWFVQNGREVNRLLADETEALVFATFPFHGLRAHGFLELQVVQAFRFKKQKWPGRAKHARRSREVADSNVQVFHIYVVYYCQPLSCTPRYRTVNMCLELDSL
jgi:hypothetical protein